MFQSIKNLFKKPAPAPCQHNPLDFGNGFTAETRDEFQYRVLEFKLPAGGQAPVIMFTYGGKEVFRIDPSGGRNI